MFILIYFSEEIPKVSRRLNENYSVFIWYNSRFESPFDLRHWKFMQAGSVEPKANSSGNR